MPGLLPDPAAFASATSSGALSVVHFAADWAEQCAQVNDVLDTYSKRPEYASIKFYKCQAEDLSEVSLKFKIEAVPTVLLFRSGKIVDRIDGADPAKIADKIKAHCNSKTEGVPLEQRLKALINRAPVMLFMKGDRETPRCGFSRQMIQILNDVGADYETFDILTDEEVRQGLKTYSDWPTYPQLYVKGELVGGLDIVKEMQAGGELAAALKV
ncbi:glutaredoxin-3 [Tribolium castaneum]|uniref:Glutaredoxin 3-like Protein n=1 Tax=Tribolium castaneum TaxID=7070 RepID=D6WB96_TRICA|nr:PREDICTED: glutaredoxin-3 [Tribolium castaneum]EEZ97918.1 Glutaredoxin 3-like Protein [Tribolium castaneum]|eukprot:XP_972466.1 PREDICTED: glutaredoxin-3 [Tribolium castaneum]